MPNGEIEQRVGIRARRFAADGEALTDIALQAGEMAIANAGIDRSKIALTLLATSTPDHLLPPSAPLLAHKLGLVHSGGIDLAGACSGFLYALALADGFVRTHQVAVLVVAANILSRRIDWSDRASAVLFADAAGAVVLRPTARPGTGVLGVRLACDGSAYDLIRIQAGGSRRPFAEDVRREDTLMRIADGKAVFTKAIAMMTDSARDALRAAAIAGGQVAHFVPHQANARIIDAVARKLAIPADRTLTSLGDYGNSSAATIPLTLSLHAGQRAYQPGDRILMTAAGAGLTGGALVWGM